MKAFFPVVAALLTLVSGANAHANGVERGDISFSISSDIPKGVEDQIETTMFENCDFRGAVHINTTYLKASQADGATTYDIQYSVDFPKQARQALIYVRASLFYGEAPDSAVKIESFASSICRAFP